MGEGPLTGRKMGRCTNFGAGHTSKNEENPDNTTDFINDEFRGRGIGLGRGRGGQGRGMGRQNRFRGGGNL
jgi:hypothetical protein